MQFQGVYMCIQNTTILFFFLSFFLQSNPPDPEQDTQVAEESAKQSAGVEILKKAGLRNPEVFIICLPHLQLERD